MSSFNLKVSFFSNMSDFQLAILFPYIPFAGLLIAYFLVDIINGSDDDDDHGGGKGIRVRQPVPVTVPAGAYHVSSVLFRYGRCICLFWRSFSSLTMIPLALLYSINSIPAAHMGLLEFFGMLTIGVAAGSLGVL